MVRSEIDRTRKLSLVSLEMSTTWITQIPVGNTESNNPKNSGFNLVMIFLRLVVMFLKVETSETAINSLLADLKIDQAKWKFSTEILLVFYFLKNLKIQTNYRP